MEKIEAIVDTCFLQKLSSEGKNADNIKSVLAELNYKPVAHPYICRHELELNSYSKLLVDSGYIRKIEYSEFIGDSFSKQLYEDYFINIYEEMRLLLEAKGGPKQLEKLKLHSIQDIYDTHKQGSSMGDVHMILMAAFLRMPLILTEDSDIALLRSIATRKMSLGTYKLEIVNAVDLIMEIARKADSSLSKKDLERILNEMKEREHRSEMKTIWNNNHL